MQASTDFQSRLDAVFGALVRPENNAAPAAGWAVSTQQVFREGQNAGDSSEDEAEIQREREVRDLTGLMLIACQAFELTCPVDPHRRCRAR